MDTTYYMSITLLIIFRYFLRLSTDQINSFLYLSQKTMALSYLSQIFISIIPLKTNY